MNIQPQYARLLADTARKIIQHEEEELESIKCHKCGSVGVCSCNSYDPIPALGIKDVLVNAGYNLNTLAHELDVCANCFEVYEGPTVEFKGMSYCCRSCAEGGDCVCEPTQTVVSGLPEHQPDQVDGHRKVNSFWAATEQASAQEPEGFLEKHNALWSEQNHAERSTAAESFQPKKNSYWNS